MQKQKKVLLIGLHPSVVDYSSAPGLDATKLWAGLNEGENRLNELGYDAKWCLTDLGETAEAVVLERLRQTEYDCILIGAGVRTMASHFLLFEKLINLLHEHAPRAKICFNTRPTDTAEAVQRWI
jgi:hypothetical protein